MICCVLFNCFVSWWTYFWFPPAYHPLFLQYLECEEDNKPSQLVDLLIKNKSKKIIVWVIFYISNVLVKQSVLLVIEIEIIFTIMISSHLQIFYDVCMCWLLGSCSSTSYCFKGLLTDSPSWEDEAGEFWEMIFMVLKFMNIVYSDTYNFFCLLDCKRESIGFIYISHKWHSSMYGCCSTWTWYSRRWLYSAGSIINN